MTTNCRLREELEQARAELAEMAQPLRVPFSDEQIEKMAKAAHTRRMRDEERTVPWKDLPLFAKDAWMQGIRAAVAAGGLEPCPVPEYRPEDVALSTRLKRATSRDLREIAIRAYLSNEQAKRENAGCMVEPMGDAVEAIRKALSDDNGLAEHIQGELKALSERLARVSAKSARRRTAIKQLQKAHDGWRKLAFKYDEHIKHLQQQSENRSENYKTLLEQRNHFRDELKAAITERDALKDEAVAVTPSPDEVEKLARVLRSGFSGYEVSDLGAMHKYWRDSARAAIAHLRPTTGHVLRDRLVEARRKAENQRVELARLNAENATFRAQLAALHPGETVEGVVMERDNYKSMLEEEVACGAEYLERAESLGCPKDGNINDAYAWALSELTALRERAEQAEAERDDLQCESSIIGELRAILGLGWCESISQRCKELAALRQRESVPVKVRFAKDRFEFRDWLNENTRLSIHPDEAQSVMDYIAAHAVIDVPAGVPSGDPDAWKTPIDIVDRDGDAIEVSCGDRDTIQVKVNDTRMVLMPSEAARVSCHLASYAAAHGCPVALPAPERPKGLPSIDDIAALIWECDGPHGYNYNPVTCEHTRKAAEIAFTALAPFLREPVGKPELDVTWEELYNTYQKALQGNQGSWKAVLDLCRSRIRPVYECKECAALRQKLHYAAEAWRKIRDDEASDALDAALEGE